MPRPVFVCSECSRPIFEGQDVLDYMGEQLCRKCIEKLTRKAVKIHEPDGGELLRPRE